MNEKNFYTKNVLIGSSGGIGNALKKELSLKFGSENLICYSRNIDNKLDLTNEPQISEATEELKSKNVKINILINAIGYLHDENYFPEKRISDINNDYMLKSFKVNSIAHALIIKYFSPLMAQDSTSVLACLSARVGSISDNYLGGWFSYRASKAALNQIVKSSSIEFKRKKSNIIFVCIHPGTVLTNLSNPFLNKDKNNFFTTEESAKKILKLISTLKVENSGNFLDYQGKIIPY